MELGKCRQCFQNLCLWQGNEIVPQKRMGGQEGEDSTMGVTRAYLNANGNEQEDKNARGVQDRTLEKAPEDTRTSGQRRGGQPQHLPLSSLCFCC